MKFLKTIPYDNVKFKFISNHYDIHLKGTCMYKGSLCEFKTNLHFDDIFEEIVEMVDIYELTKVEKLKWLTRQFMFELCVGKHWSYHNGKKKGEYYTRNPKWLYRMLFRLYYKFR